MRRVQRHKSNPCLCLIAMKLPVWTHEYHNIKCWKFDSDWLRSFWDMARSGCVYSSRRVYLAKYGTFWSSAQSHGLQSEISPSPVWDLQVLDSWACTVSRSEYLFMNGLRLWGPHQEEEGHVVEGAETLRQHYVANRRRKWTRNMRVHHQRLPLAWLASARSIKSTHFGILHDSSAASATIVCVNSSHCLSYARFLSLLITRRRESAAARWTPQPGQRPHFRLHAHTELQPQEVTE